MDIIAFYLRLSLADGDLGKNNKDESNSIENRSRENKWKALCGNYVGGVLGVPHGLLSGGVLLIKMFDKL